MTTRLRGMTGVTRGQGTAMITPTRAQAREAKDSPVVERLARLGLAARGVVWLVVGLLALSVLLGGGDRQTDRQGALRAIADKPFGEVLLVVLVVGFAGYALWRALSAAVGHTDEDGAKRTGKRLLSAGKAVLYASLAVSTLRFLLSGSGSGDQTTSRTAQVMQHSGGRWLVGLAGLVVIAVGVGMVVRAAMGKHLKKLESWRLPGGSQDAVRWVGTAGLSGRGLVLALVGGFLVQAAVRFDPGDAKGLDGALQSLAGQAYGRVLLAVAVLGLIAYGAWSFVEAGYRRL